MSEPYSKEYDYSHYIEAELGEEESQNNRYKKLFSGYSPVFIVSLALHCLLLLIIALFPSKSKPPKKREISIIEFIDTKDDPPPPIIEKIELTTKDIKIKDEIEKEIIDPTEDQPKEDLPEEIPNESIELAELMPELDIISEVVAPDILSFNASPVGGASGIKGPYDNRTGPGKGDALIKHKIPPESEDAVKAALDWLAYHQEPEGHWDSAKYEGEAKATRGALTALAVLPFLGAGHGENIGEYKNTVRGAIRTINREVDIALKSKNQSEIRQRFHNNYGLSIALMALSETSIFGSSPLSKKNANILTQKFINQYKATEQGWHYHANGNDFSVSGWVALALKSAKSANLPALRSREYQVIFEKYKKWVDEVATNKITGNGQYRASSPSDGAGKNSMRLVGFFNKQILGYRRSDPFFRNALPKIIDHMPKLAKDGKPAHVYNMYYGTLAALQHDDHLWDKWRPFMLKTILGSQNKGNVEDKGGSWDPTGDHTGHTVGRVGTTALLTLCLEVAYRNYLNS